MDVCCALEYETLDKLDDLAAVIPHTKLKHLRQQGPCAAVKHSSMELQLKT
jgi:hypothetical protein